MSDSAVQANALAVELSQYGEVQVVALTRLQKLTSEHLIHNWLTIPHVTHHNEADVTDLERADAGTLLLKRLLPSSTGVRRRSSESLGS